MDSSLAAAAAFITFHLAAQLLEGRDLGAEVSVAGQLVHSGRGLRAGPVRQAALRGALIPALLLLLLLPVEVVLHQELQLCPEEGTEEAEVR